MLSAQAVAGFRSTLDGLGFTAIHTPKIVASATESGANVFALDYFGTPAYLAQSPQFYKQMMVGVLERVYEVGPVFRAEPHETGRHLAQYTSLDVELGFIRDHFDVMAIARDVVAGMVAATGLDAAIPAAIPWLHFADAMEMVGAATRRGPVRRARPGARARAMAGRLGAARARLRLRLRDRLSDGQAAVLHAPRARPGRRTRTALT